VVHVATQEEEESEPEGPVLWSLIVGIKGKGKFTAWSQRRGLHGVEIIEGGDDLDAATNFQVVKSAVSHVLRGDPAFADEANLTQKQGLYVTRGVKNRALPAGCIGEGVERDATKVTLAKVVAASAAIPLRSLFVCLEPVEEEPPAKKKKKDKKGAQQHERSPHTRMRSACMHASACMRMGACTHAAAYTRAPPACTLSPLPSAAPAPGHLLLPGDGGALMEHGHERGALKDQRAPGILVVGGAAGAEVFARRRSGALSVVEPLVRTMYPTVRDQAAVAAEMVRPCLGSRCAHTRWLHTRMLHAHGPQGPHGPHPPHPPTQPPPPRPRRAHLAPREAARAHTHTHTLTHTQQPH
jgi:hypothetical protein